MKKMRRLIPAIAMLLVSAVMLSTASFAWFTMSNKATASGMTVTATASSSLLIVDAKNYAEGSTTNYTVGADRNDFLGATGMVTLANPALAMMPATHVSTTTGEGDSAVTTHKMMAPVGDTAMQGIDPSTGLGVNGAEVSLTDVTDAEHSYYYDYVVALATAGAEVTGALTVVITPEYEDYMHNATAIDFWVQEWDATANDGAGASAAATYVTTVHFNDKGTDGKIAAVTLDGDITIPLTSEDATGYVLVTMRVYFDGAELDPDGKAYVRNSYASTDGAKFGAEFTITAADDGE